MAVSISSGSRVLTDVQPPNDTAVTPSDTLVVPPSPAGFNDYLEPSCPLEDRVIFEAHNCGVPRADLNTALAIIKPLQHHHLPTYHHCLRIGLLSAQIGEHEKLDSAVLLIAGLLHDCGKRWVSPALLDKKVGWTPADTKELEPHVCDGYKMIRDQFPLHAEVVIWHHGFQPVPYPAYLPYHTSCFDNDPSLQLTQLRRVLALADCYDAIHRINDRNGKNHELSGQQIQARVHQLNPDIPELINRLYKSDILTEALYGAQPISWGPEKDDSRFPASRFV